MKSLSTLVVFLSVLSILFGQKPIDIKLEPTLSRDGASCFDIELRSSAGYDINLAGQNYRIFFNGQIATFREDLTEHTLDKQTYGKLDVLASVHNNIGFVSLSIDSRIFTERIVRLDREGTWFKTMNLCFDHDENATLDLTWANARKTSRFATAEIAFSEWVSAEKQQILYPQEVSDFSSADFKDEVNLLDLTVYPNPASDYLQIELNGNTEMRRLIIKDIIGRVYVNQDFDGQDVITHQISSWPEGSYTALLADKEGKYISSETVVKINP